MMQDSGSPDKYDLFIQKIDHFQSLVEEKKQLQATIAEKRKNFEESIQPLESELAAIIKKLEQNLSKLEGTTPAKTKASGTRFGRGQLGAAIKQFLGSNTSQAFKPREIADALGTKGTTISLWLNKYGSTDPEIEKIPTGPEGKRFLYKKR